jgi:hypothetical protein
MTDFRRQTNRTLRGRLHQQIAIEAAKAATLSSGDFSEIYFPLLLPSIFGGGGLVGRVADRGICAGADPLADRRMIPSSPILAGGGLPLSPSLINSPTRTVLEGSLGSLDIKN